MIAAAVVAAAALADTLRSFPAADGADIDPILEAVVLDRTIDGFEERYLQNPGNPVVGASLADAHLLKFRLDNELWHLDRAETISAELAPLALRPAPAYARLAAAKLSRHDFAGALAAAEMAIQTDSTDEGALGTLFDATVAAGEYGRAEWARRRLEAGHRGTLAQQLRTSRWLEASGDADGAFQVLFSACKRLKTRAVRRQVLAWCRSLVGDLEVARSGPRAAARWYRRALDAQPEYMAALEGLADLAYARADWKRARDLYSRIVRDAHPDLSLRLSEVSGALGDRAAAERYEQDFLRLATAPGAEPLNAHALALYYASRADTRDLALAVIQRDLARRGSVEAYEVMAWVRLQRGELREALEASDRSRRWGSPSASNDYVRGSLLLALGREAEGRRLVQASLADPTQLDHHVLRDRRTVLPVVETETTPAPGGAAAERSAGLP